MNKKIQAITKKMKEERKTKNKELLDILTDLVNKTDGHLRFSQLLAGYGFVKDIAPLDPVRGDFNQPAWENEFYTEPREVLERVLKELKRIEG